MNKFIYISQNKVHIEVYVRFWFNDAILKATRHPEVITFHFDLVVVVAGLKHTHNFFFAAWLARHIELQLNRMIYTVGVD